MSLRLLPTLPLKPIAPQHPDRDLVDSEIGGQHAVEGLAQVGGGDRWRITVEICGAAERALAVCRNEELDGAELAADLRAVQQPDMKPCGQSGVGVRVVDLDLRDRAILSSRPGPDRVRQGQRLTERGDRIGSSACRRNTLYLAAQILAGTLIGRDPVGNF